MYNGLQVPFTYYDSNWNRHFYNHQLDINSYMDKETEIKEKFETLRNHTYIHFWIEKRYFLF